MRSNSLFTFPSLQRVILRNIRSKVEEIRGNRFSRISQSSTSENSYTFEKIPVRNSFEVYNESTYRVQSGC